jgi:hypothetical protein
MSKSRSFSLNNSLKMMTGFLLLSQTLCISTMPAFADTAVRVAGQQVFTMSATATARAGTTQDNLDNALVATKDRNPTAVGITYVNGLPVITLGGYQVVTVTAADAKQAATTPALLAQRWTDSLKKCLNDKASVNSYISQLSGSTTSSAPSAPDYAANPAPAANYAANADTYNTPGARTPYMPYNQVPQAQTPPPQYGYNGGSQAQYNTRPNNYAQGPGYRQGRIAYAPAGLVLPLQLRTSISTSAAKAGDMVQAEISQTMQLGDASIPSGSVVTGTITEAKPGGRLSRSGELGIKFTSIRTPDGVETPITAHLVGEIGKYAQKDDGDGNQVVHGEGMTAKLGQTAIRGGIGAGAGAALGTAVGAIAGGGYGAGRGAWSGAAIGGGLGVADMALRKGRDVTLRSGTKLEIKLDNPVSIAGAGSMQSGNL